MSGSQRFILQPPFSVTPYFQDKDDEFPVNALCIEICFQAKEGQLLLSVERASAVHANSKQRMLGESTEILNTFSKKILTIQNDRKK